MADVKSSSSIGLQSWIGSFLPSKAALSKTVQALPADLVALAVPGAQTSGQKAHLATLKGRIQHLSTLIQETEANAKGAKNEKYRLQCAQLAERYRMLRRSLNEEIRFATNASKIGQVGKAATLAALVYSGASLVALAIKGANAGNIAVHGLKGGSWLKKAKSLVTWEALSHLGSTVKEAALARLFG